MALSEEDKKWLDAKFSYFEKKINDLEIKTDRALVLARAMADKVC